MGAGGASRPSVVAQVEVADLVHQEMHEQDHETHEHEMGAEGRADGLALDFKAFERGEFLLRSEVLRLPGGQAEQDEIMPRMKPTAVRRGSA